jgi:uncharacterized protein (TIGR02646 family)
VIKRPFNECFKEPNFECFAEDLDEKRIKWITWAISQEELQDKLVSKGLRIINISQYNFAEWKERASQALDEARKAHEEHRDIIFKDEIWQQLKKYLFEIFDGKCAYCDSFMHTSDGEVEHFRPKRKVEEDPHHPGYYWLAYKPENLLPVCVSCNRERGKQKHFPIKTHRCYSPEDKIINEDPLLVNPFFDNPKEHFSFEESGIVKGISERGEKSCKIYHLNRTPLQEERRKAQRQIVKDIKLAIFSATDNLDELKNIMRMIDEGKVEFSATLSMCANLELGKLLGDIKEAMQPSR